MLFLLLKWVHVLSAIVAVGSNITYAFWISRATAGTDALPFTLKTIRYIDNRLANPAYGLLLITGLSMVVVGQLQLLQPWLLTALTLYVFIALVGFIAFGPSLRHQIQALETEGAASANYQTLARRSTTFGIATVALVVVIVFLMVVKPGA